MRGQRPALLLSIALSVGSATLVCVCPASGPAQDTRARHREGGWHDLFDAEHRLGNLYLRHGLAKLMGAMDRRVEPELGDPPRWLLIDQALVRFERARRHIPNDPELAYLTAYALTRWERPLGGGAMERRDEEGLDAWLEVRRLAPRYMPGRVAYELAMLYMRRHEFERARHEYEIALSLAPDRAVQLQDRFYIPAPTERRLAMVYAELSRANVHGNLAEVTMLCGEVTESVRHYRLAIQRADDPVTRSLAQWGLATALDRVGRREEALRTAATALRGDPIPPDHPDFIQLHRQHGPMTVLHIAGVFFEPAYEVHAYEALGYEAMRNMTSPYLGSEVATERALRSWRTYLTEGGASSRFAEIARQHIERLSP